METNISYDNYLGGQTVIIDPFIHKKAKISREEFLKRIKNITAIRARGNDRSCSFYITSLDEYKNLACLHRGVNKGEFDFVDYTEDHVFAIYLQPKLHKWLKNNKFLSIKMQIENWLAANYYFTPDERIMRKQEIYPLLFKEIIGLVKDYYEDFELPDFDLLEEQLSTNDDETFFEKIKECKQKYLAVCNKLYQADPPEFLQNPFEYKYLPEWGIGIDYNFVFGILYFKKGEWQKIIIENKDDYDVNAVESNSDMWQKWKHTYALYDNLKEIEYSSIIKPLEKQEKPRKLARKISQEVKDKVWRRDEGKCVKCGSNEKLEFDHIIPVSKGGASTYRNVQLLCESCNRKKSDKI